ncbi:cytochrome P450 1A1 [Xenopus laevis]|uniref:Cytochrome P450 1A n=2 Tax=Xenopus laevis TaxID=8355 RepID=A0A8J0T5G2_XENLA|nr:cytochrome P450 1A1 [Xenopus laevis]
MESAVKKTLMDMMPLLIKASLSLLTVLLVMSMLWKKRNSPPGPWPMPIVGNFFQLGDQMHISLTDMRHKYGDVFQIKLGLMPIVVVSGFETVKTVLLKEGEHFADRPNFYSFSLFSDGKSMTFSEKYGESWKIHKKIMKNALRTLSNESTNLSNCSCRLEEYVCAEASDLVQELIDMSAEEVAFDPSSLIVITVANVVCALSFGKRYDHQDKEFLTLIDLNNDLRKAFGGGLLADFIPILRFIPSPSLKALKKFLQSFQSFIAQCVKDHFASFEENTIRDITDALIQLCKERKSKDKSQQLSDEQIIATVNDIFGAGFDTITSALLWAIFYLLRYPEFQDKIHKEIEEKIGCSRAPRFNDRKDLHYTEAFINEVLRHSSFVPFGLPHCTTVDTKLNGYFIPKGTCVFTNLYQVNHDNTVWKDADMFMPERFLDENGQIIKSLTEKVLIFGMGVRKCVGEDVARNEIFVIMATMMQRLKLVKSTKHELDPIPVYGLTFKPKAYYLVAEIKH